MTDYFALLEQPRQPWLDLDELKRRYQTFALTEHPDQKHSTDATADFATLNEAYRCLRDPKLRLQHLLALEGNPPGRDEIIPPDLFDFFSEVSHFIEKADGLLARRRAQQNALSRSLLHSEFLIIQHDATKILEKLRHFYAEALGTMRAANDRWKVEIESLKTLYLRLAYLGRWIQQVEERNFALASLA